MSEAVYKVEIAWTADPGLVARIGTWQIGVHRLGGGVAESDWTDETANVKSASIRRGRSGDLGVIMRGTCDLTLNDHDGTYNPANTGSTLYPHVVPMRPVRITATFSGTDYRRFYGYIQRIRHYPHASRQETVIECADLFAWLEADYPVIAALGATDTGAAIRKVLDTSDVTDLSMYDLDTGDALSDFSADGTQTGLSLIQRLVEAERGTFYASREGKAVYEDRYARFVPPRDVDQSTIANIMQGLSAETDAFMIYNHITCTRTGGVAQASEDVSSQHSYARRPLSLTSDHWVDDAQAAGVAGHIMGMNGTPKTPVDIEIMNSSDAQLTALLSRDLNDRVGISEARGGTTGSYFIESIDERISDGGKLHRASWRLSRFDSMPFIIGYAVIGKAFIAH